MALLLKENFKLRASLEKHAVSRTAANITLITEMIFTAQASAMPDI
jgi:hypothetical protein